MTFDEKVRTILRKTKINTADLHKTTDKTVLFCNVGITKYLILSNINALHTIYYHNPVDIHKYIHTYIRVHTYLHWPNGELN